MAEHPAVVFLRAELDRVEEHARAAGGGETEAVDYLWETKYLNVHQPDSVVQQTTEFSAVLADHFALHGPAAVLRRVAADRQILAEHGLVEKDRPGFDVTEGKLIVCSTCWGEVWPCRTVRLLAEAWGWTEDTV